MGEDRHLLQNTCKGRAHASKQAVAGAQGPGRNEGVMGVETLSSGACSDWQPDYLVSFPPWDFGSMAGLLWGKRLRNHHISRWLDSVLKYTEEDFWPCRDKQKEAVRLLAQERALPKTLQPASVPRHGLLALGGSNAARRWWGSSYPGRYCGPFPVLFVAPTCNPELTGWNRTCTWCFRHPSRFPLSGGSRPPMCSCFPLPPHHPKSWCPCFSPSSPAPAEPPSRTPLD